MNRHRTLLTLAYAFVTKAAACTCVYWPPPREALKSAAVVLRGTVVKADKFPEHPRMRGRQRWAVTLRVVEYWKGNPGQIATLYDLDPGTDCMGAGLQVGKEYLIFASEETAKDYQPDADFFWYGWTDVLAPGTPILHPKTACPPAAALSIPTARQQLLQLGQGKVPRKPISTPSLHYQAT